MTCDLKTLMVSFKLSVLLMYLKANISDLHFEMMVLMFFSHKSLLSNLNPC